MVFSRVCVLELQVLQLIPHASQVVTLWTIYVGMILYYDLLFYYVLLNPHICSVSTSCSGGGSLIFYLLLPQGCFMYNLWLLSIYNYRYFLVSLYFTNWSIPHSYSSLSLSYNLSQAKVVTSSKNRFSDR